MSDFVHLHNHTDYSLLDGAAPIKRYVKKAAELGMTSLAMTDHGNMFGAVKFYRACKEAGIKPIIGTEFYISPDGRTLREGSKPYHLILLAMDDTGYHNLMELNSIAWLEGFYRYPRIDRESLRQHSDGLICMSACLAGELARALLDGRDAAAQETVDWYRSVFGDRYYIELQNHFIPEEIRVLPLLADLARRNGIKTVATNDIHYIEESDANAHDILLCIGTNKFKSDPNRMRFQTQEFYFKTPRQMAELFSDYPEAVENTAEVASRCNLEIQFPGALLPNYPVPEGFGSEEAYLRHLAEQGLRRRYDTITETLTARLQYELDTIARMKFPGYYLIVRDYIYWAKQHDIPVGPGRGSGAGSLVAYCVDITDVDPMRYGLMFERFLNPERKSMPDFDIDFCFENRGKVIDYVTEMYGRDRVGQIATFGTLKAKAVLKDVARVLQIPYSESNEISKLVPDNPDDPAKDVPITLALEITPQLAELRAKGGVYEELFDVATRLQGLNRHISMHAAGVVIGKDVLTKYVPLYKDSRTGTVTTQYTMDVIEDCGLVKMDFLGLKTLTLLRNAERLIKKRLPQFDLKDIPLDDPATYRLVGEGDTACVFQFESPGMQKYLKALKPTKIEEMVAMNALYRPGPMQFIDRYIEGKHNQDKITYPDPELEEVLKETYGVIVYQEQVMAVARLYAGFSLGEADVLRKIMGKKKADMLDEQEKKFIERAVSIGRDRKKAQDLFELLKPFGHYGFNKSHSVAYAIIAYQTAYLKANFPAEFMAANLTNETGSPDKFSEYLALCRSMKLKILPPSINDSDTRFNVVGGNIVYGLSGIKGIGEAAADEIIAEREKNGPYRDFMDFLRRSSPRLINAKTLEALIDTGTFDFSGVNRRTLKANYPEAARFVRDEKESLAAGQMSLFSLEDEPQAEFRMTAQDDYTFLEKLDLEKNLLGFYVSGHPMEMYQDVWTKCVHINLADTSTIIENKPETILGLVREIREITTKKGRLMAKVFVSDYNGQAELTVFSDVWEQIRSKVRTDSIHGFSGKFSTYNGQMSMAVENFWEDPRDLLKNAMSNLYFEVDRTRLNSARMNEISDLLLSYEGKLRSHLILCEFALVAGEDPDQAPVEVVRNREPYILGPAYSVRCDDTLLEKLSQLEGVHRVWFE